MSEPKFITPNNPGRMAEVNTEIREILESGECAKVKITQAAESLRTIEQNDRMWAMLGDVSKQVKWDVDGVRRYMKPREWKHVFTAALEKHQSVARGIEGGWVMLGQSTSAMSVKKMIALMEIMEAFGADPDHPVTFKDSPAREPSYMDEIEAKAA